MAKDIQFKKPILLFLVIFNLLLFLSVVFLMNNVQTMLAEDTKANLSEIVKQNERVITGKLSLDINKLDLISMRISEYLKNNNSYDKADIKKLLAQFSLENNMQSLFVADIDGLAITAEGDQLDISGRSYFKLAKSGIANISDKTISRFNGDDVFVISVPLYYKNNIIGTIQKAYNQTEINELFSISLFSSQSYIYVVNSRGYIVLHPPHANCVMKSDNYFRDIYESGNKEASQQLAKDIQNNHSGLLETVIGTQKTFAAYTPLNQIHDWYLITGVPTNAVASNANTVIDIFYFILSFVVLIFTSSIAYFLWYKNKQKNVLEEIAFVDTVTKGNTFNKFILDVRDTLDNNPDKQFYILKFDIDNFKYINNFYGFDFGDIVLQKINTNISDKLHDNEFIARVYGDNFVALLSDAKADRLENLLYSMVNEEDVTVYFSAGVYAISDINEDISLMVDKAGTAAQTVKGTLNKKIAFYSEEFDQQTQQNEQLKRAVKHALDNSEFIPFYQPKVNVLTGQVVGAEALARWRKADNKFVFPNEFIPLCEKTGMIVDVDLMIFEKVLQFLQKSIQEGVECKPISVNFSRFHLLDDLFFDKLTAKVQAYNVPPNLIELELTESAIFDNMDSIYAFTQRLHQSGFLISMDDFGSGYSSLNMLKDIPIDVLKIDKGFLSDTIDDNRRNIIFASIAQMASKLSIKVVVEGVETKENILLMTQCGCTIAQGYYFARPMPEADFDKLFKAGVIC